MSCGKCARLEEFNKLIAYLNDNKYSFNTRQVSCGLYCGGKLIHDMEMNTITVSEDLDRSWKVRCSIGTCGYELGLLEEEGLLGTDEVLGYMTSENIIDLIEKRERSNQ